MASVSTNFFELNLKAKDYANMAWKNTLSKLVEDPSNKQFDKNVKIVQNIEEFLILVYFFAFL